MNALFEDMVGIYLYVDVEIILDTGTYEEHLEVMTQYIRYINWNRLASKLKETVYVVDKLI